MEEELGYLPRTIVADAGYGSEENYEYLGDNDLEGYVKYNKFHQRIFHMTGRQTALPVRTAKNYCMAGAVNMLPRQVMRPDEIITDVKIAVDVRMRVSAKRQKGRERSKYLTG